MPPLTKFSSEIYTDSQLIFLVEDGRLALPEFQRDFVWRPPQVVDLLLSVARQWPIGSFLLLEGPQDFAARPLEQAPPLTTAEMLILDGQQRMTALYQAFSDTAEDVYCVDLGALRESGELTDDLIFSLKRKTFARRYPTTQDLVDQRIAPIYVLHHDKKFFEWISFLPKPQQADFIQVRDDQLPGFKTYDIPVVRLPRNVPLQALAKIFETINRTGVRLSAFDLMVARLYPHNFNLAEVWDEAYQTRGNTFGQYDVAGIEILKLIALMEHLLPTTNRPAIRGIRESDILNLSPEQVIERWDAAVEAYETAITFLRDRCGVVRAFLLPPSAMVLTLAAILGTVEGEDSENILEDWLWASVFRQTYAQGANTQALTDARELLTAVHEGESPAIVRRFSIDQEALLDTRRRNEILLRGILALLIRNQATDWAGRRTPLSRATGTLVIHRVFPAQYLMDRGHSPDLLMNFTVLRQRTNGRLAGVAPSEAVAAGWIHTDALESHLIDPTTLISDEFPVFIERRFKAVLTRALDTVGR